ncbi:hypothetical protein Drorol1_Dr00027876 [Drosera rotundifolia]
MRAAFPIYLPTGALPKLVFWAVLAKRHSPSAAGPETLAPGLIRRIAKSDERVCVLLILTPHLIRGIRDKGVFYLFGLTLNIISSIFHRWPRCLAAARVGLLAARCSIGFVNSISNSSSKVGHLVVVSWKSRSGDWNCSLRWRRSFYFGGFQAVELVRNFLVEA